nr:putative secreted protein [Salmonella sp. NCTC 7297]
MDSGASSHRRKIDESASHCFCFINAFIRQCASFDCQKAQAADEKTICAHLALNDKDVEMHAKYQFLKGLFAMGRRGALQDAQQSLAETASAVQGRRHLPDKSL